MIRRIHAGPIFQINTASNGTTTTETTRTGYGTVYHDESSQPNNTVRTGTMPSSLTLASIDVEKKKKPPSVEKIKVHFVSVGSAPILKKTKFQISADQRFASVYAFLRKVLKLQVGDSLFLYLQAAFCPGPEELVGDLNECFSRRGELVIHYSLQQAWG